MAITKAFGGFKHLLFLLALLSSLPLGAYEIPDARCLLFLSGKHGCLVKSIDTPDFQGSTSFKPYIQKIKGKLGKKTSNRILKNYREIIKKRMQSTMPQEDLGDEWFSVNGLFKSFSELDKETEILSCALILFTLFDKHKSDIYQNLSVPDMQVIAHSFLLGLEGMPAELSPLAAGLFQSRHISTTLLFDQRAGRTINQVRYYEQTPVKNKVIESLVLTTSNLLLFHIFKYSINIPSLNSSRWLVEQVPELKKGKVLEIGAGSGVRTQTLVVNGVDIQATDIQKVDTPFRYPVEIMNAVQAIKKHPEHNVIFLENPGWSFWDDQRRKCSNCYKTDFIWPHILKKTNWTLVLLVHEGLEGVVRKSLNDKTNNSVKIERITPPWYLFSRPDERPMVLLVIRAGQHLLQWQERMAAAGHDEL